MAERRWPIATAGLALVCGMHAAAAEDFKEGEWEFKTRMVVPGLPSMDGFGLPEGLSLPEGVELPVFDREGMLVTNRSCVTRESLVPPSGEQMQGCTISDQKIEGGRIGWKVACDNAGGKMTGSGEGRYSGTQMTATMQMQGLMQGFPIMSNFTTEGRYVGACPKR